MIMIPRRCVLCCFLRLQEDHESTGTETGEWEEEKHTTQFKLQEQEEGRYKYLNISAHFSSSSNPFILNPKFNQSDSNSSFNLKY